MSTRAACQITSLRCGLAAANTEAQAAAILLGDQPSLGSRAIDEMLEAFLAAGARAARPVYPDAGGRPGHPVLLAREIFGELDVLRGDQGGGTQEQPIHDSLVFSEGIDLQPDYERLTMAVARRSADLWLNV